MGTRRRKRRRARNDFIREVKTKDERFLMRLTATYIHRHLSYLSRFDQATYQGLVGILEESGLDILDRSLNQLSGNRKEAFAWKPPVCNRDRSGFDETVDSIFEDSPSAFLKEFRQATLEVLEETNNGLKYKGLSTLEKNIEGMKRYFDFSDQETAFAVFLYVLSVNRDLQDYLVDNVQCHRFSGRRYLGNILGMKPLELEQVFHGKLKGILFFEADTSSLEMNDAFLFLFEDPKCTTPSINLYRKLPKRGLIPFDQHLTVKNEIGHVINLLREKPEASSTHILFYGPPGTGKTQFARGLAKELAIPAYEITPDENNRSEMRRAGIVACLNMTNRGTGSLILVDEADNLLNTQFSFFFRGETQDKGWLNHLLEQPGVRMVWITNTIEEIDPSVLRRFAYSLEFKPFTKSQRVSLWNNVLKGNKAKGFFREADILGFAKYQVSPGVIDLAVKKAREIKPGSREAFQKAVRMALEAHQSLLDVPGRKPEEKPLEEGYSVEGLNIKGKIETTLSQVETFAGFLRKNQGGAVRNYNLLFHGAPGTGKTELARYIGERLDREILTKRVSDLQSCWVGQTEKNIRDAFLEAEREQAILVIDEADSLIFPRDRAHHSWEVSFTNEFLTQMERFKGILICTTNRLKDLDLASIRRFQAKVEFDYLNPEGNLVFYERLLAGLLPNKALEPTLKARLKGIPNLAPGDFKTVRDRFSFHPKKALSHAVLVEALGQEAEIKKAFQEKTSIGF